MTHDELKYELANELGKLPGYYLEVDKFSIIDIALDADDFTKPSYHIMILPLEYPFPNHHRVSIFGFINGEQVSSEEIKMDESGNIYYH